MVSFNTITDNTATLEGGALHCSDGWPTIINNTICGNGAPTGGGIFLTGSGSHPTIDNTIIAFGIEGEGIVCHSDASPTLTCCDIYGNAGGDALCGLDGGNNFAADPEFCGPSGNGDYWLWDTSPCAIENSPCNMFVGAWPVGCQATGIDIENALRPPLALVRNYPNPFNPHTTITYRVPAAEVHLAVFDVQGGLVTVLKDGYHEEGEYEVLWGGTDDNGMTVAGGVYFIRLAAGGQTRNLKILLLK
ncbi:MAG: hypothetical protein JSW58_05900 [Candidatus Latescibacterota bacterium]|nr:MAG: hypothetical protein JSW58_05900 [Candidatus Latescibacterota bacterium]